jgi:two-component system response regulator
MKAVLYAEDYEDDVFFMTRALKKLAPAVRLSTVKNGSEAIAYLAGEPPFQDRGPDAIPGLVLLDISMPITNGFEVLEWIRAQENLRALPVFMLTSSNNEADRERADALGAEGYLVKPGRPDELADLLQPFEKYWL